MARKSKTIMTANISEIFLINLQQEALNCAILGTGVLDVDDMVKSKILSIHPYKITPPPTENGRWQTYIKAEDKRKKVVAQTEKELYLALAEIYFPKDNTTLGEIFAVCCDKREHEYNIQPKSIRRDRQRWDKFIKPLAIADKPVASIKPSDIETAVHFLIRKYSLTKKETNMILGMLRFCFKNAVKQELIKENPMDKAEINRNSCRAPKKKQDTTRVYLNSEISIMAEQIAIERELFPGNVQPLAVKLQFKLGLRIGELVALKWNDIDKTTNKIHIQRMETEDGEGNLFVDDRLKKDNPDCERFLQLSDYEYRIFDEVKEICRKYGYSDDNYIFVSQNGRLTRRAVDNCIRKMCRRGDIDVKSSHDIRRTVASTMHANGAPIETIRVFMGHSNEQTTWSYIYDANDQERTDKVVINALATLNM